MTVLAVETAEWSCVVPDGYLTTAEVAALLGIAPQSLRKYRSESAPGGLYENHPFPAPDGQFGRMPVWREDRKPEILRWAAGRRGPGRPRRDS